MAGHSCIGALDRWERRYLFPRRRDRGIDDRVIAFNFRQAGVFGFRPRRIVESQSPDSITFDLDHRQYRIVAGNFEIATGRLTIDCGWNCDANIPAGGSCG